MQNQYIWIFKLCLFACLNMLNYIVLCNVSNLCSVYSKTYTLNIAPIHLWFPTATSLALTSPAHGFFGDKLTLRYAIAKLPKIKSAAGHNLRKSPPKKPNLPENCNDGAWNHPSASLCATNPLDLLQCAPNADSALTICLFGRLYNYYGNAAVAFRQHPMCGGPKRELAHFRF